MKLLLAMQDHTQVKITLEDVAFPKVCCMLPCRLMKPSQDMRSRGIKPNVVTYNSLIKERFQQCPFLVWPHLL